MTAMKNIQNVSSMKKFDNYLKVWIISAASFMFIKARTEYIKYNFIHANLKNFFQKTYVLKTC